jgi:hypothetical protein
MKIKRKLKKKEEKQILISKAKDYTKFSTDENERSKVFSMMGLSNLCKHYRNYFNIPGITEGNLLRGDTKIPKLAENNTLWCTFKLEDIIQRSFRSMTRLVKEFDYEELHNPNQRKIQDFKNEFVVAEFSKMYQKELKILRTKFRKYLKTRYRDTETAIKQILVISAYYNIFKMFVQRKLREFDKKNRMYIKTFITKTDKKFEEIKEVILEGGEADFEQDAITLLGFEEAGLEIAWIGYKRKEAIKIKNSQRLSNTG